MNRLRIVHVAFGLDVGGLEKLLVEFARHADRDATDLRFVSLGERGALAEDIETCGWPVTALSEPQGLRPQMIARLARLFRAWRPDVVHTHDDRPLVYAVPAARLARVPCVIHTRHGRNFANTARQNVLARWASRLPDCIVCVSDDSTRVAVEQGVPAKRIVTLHNGIDLDRFPFRGPQPNGPVVTVARLSPEKGIDTLLLAAALVAEQEPGFRLEIAGDGPCRTGLEASLTTLRLGGAVRLLGNVRDVPGLLQRARMFVLPSLSEGVPLTLLEAMATGLPVVATQVGGNPEVIADTATGVLVPAGNPPALAAAMRGLWCDAAACVRLGAAGRKRVEQLFDVRRMVAAYEALYRDIAKAHVKRAKQPLATA
jgi:glycosyltransferase involved in cell wall biosynthesis